MTTPTHSAVIPYRRRADGTVELCLITNSRGDRWVIPKGWLEPHLTPADSAAKEAFEEAGLIGTAADDAVAIAEYEKESGRVCQVAVYLMPIDEVLDDWDENGLRQRRFVSADEARALITPEFADALAAGLERIDGPEREQ